MTDRDTEKDRVIQKYATASFLPNLIFLKSYIFL